MAGLEFVYRLCGAGPTVKNVLGPLTALHKGDAVNLASGSVAIGGSTSANFLGVAIGDFAGNAGAKADRLPVIVDEDAVYSAKDAAVRKIGDCLDIAGATGAQTVVTGVQKNFVVVEDSRADEPTRFRFNVGKHVFNKAQ